MNQNQIVIKVLGSESHVKAVLKKIETLFPVYIEGKIQPNDTDTGVHCFLTVAVGDAAE